jgi:hypothetical protein
LRDTLTQIEPFTESAAPTLDAATRAAPKLSVLGRRATPDLRRVQPTVAALGELSTSLVPVSQTLSRSSDNALAILENWARAIQFRDGLGHVFRGEASFSPDALRTAVERLVGPSRASKRRKVAAPKATPPAAPNPKASAPKRPQRRTDAPPAIGELAPILEGLLGKAPAVPPADTLLDFLLKP